MILYFCGILLLLSFSRIIELLSETFSRIIKLLSVSIFHRNMRFLSHNCEEIRSDIRVNVRMVAISSEKLRTTNYKMGAKNQIFKKTGRSDHVIETCTCFSDWSLWDLL